MNREEMIEIVKTFNAEYDMIRESRGRDNNCYDAIMDIVRKLNQRLMVYGLRCVTYEDFHDLKDWISDHKPSASVIRTLDPLGPE